MLTSAFLHEAIAIHEIAMGPAQYSCLIFERASAQAGANPATRQCSDGPSSFRNRLASISRACLAS